MKKVALMLTVLLAVSGCGAAHLPYRPDPGAENAPPVSADYQLTQDRLYVYVESQGWRVDSAMLVSAEGTELPALKTVRPKSVPAPRIGVGAGVGVGTGSLRRSGGVGVGIGAGVGTETRGGQTVAIFDAEEAGPGPWQLHVQIAGFPVAKITLPAPEPGDG